MPNDPRFGLGRSFIHLASILMVLNVLGWLLFGMPLTIMPALAVLWLVGILTHIVEPSRLRKAKR